MSTNSRFNHPEERITKRARELRHPLAPPEAILWSKIRGGQLSGYKFRRQHPVGHYVADFYCATARLIVELDGDSHAEQVEYDAARTAWLESEGYRVIRFFNSEVVSNLEGVMDSILMACENGQG